MPDMQTFQAVNDACLVFDGRLVINNHLETNDKHILAAGPFTKYSRKFFAEHRGQDQFNSAEVGFYLAELLAARYDPLAKFQALEGSELPVFTQPKCTVAQLPGGFHLLWKRDALPVKVERRISTTAAKPEDAPGIFKICTNPYGAVCDVICLSKNSSQHSNIAMIHGLHEKYLNNLLSRFDEGIIPDLFAFFRESWAVAIFHDRFREFINGLTLQVSKSAVGETFVAAARQFSLTSCIVATRPRHAAKAVC
eukprot:m.141701 g.141701  ORF g.141701 m.141701 type:complete len:252 (+) comp10025_c0_seq1:232-987(+)